MESVLKHLVEITGHRDHLLLDTSVVSALHGLISASQVRALEIFKLREDLYVRPRVWIENGKVVSSDERMDCDQNGDPITDYPSLMLCLEQRMNSVDENAADGTFVLWLPVWLNDKLSTCLQVVSVTPFTPEARQVIEGILSVYRNYQNLLDYSERDSLTGLFNRKTFDEKFSRMVASSLTETASPPDEPERRHASTLREQWLGVVDIDHFKRVNDQFGHLYGDEVLILVANILRASFRSQDRVFRFGGEEFVILLRSTTLDDTLKIFERFRRNIENHEFPQVGRVTISLGFASISKETPVVILGHADQALYYAKENGRNQVCNYDELISAGKLQAEVPLESDVEFFFDDPA
ncbi:MAG: GGDEF domain-containing protein [Herminiimonas sp.]|nr:GGDEF domain-containing protein [Herminiimonas sp.]